jgi:hypothetical protein
MMVRKLLRPGMILGESTANPFFCGLFNPARRSLEERFVDSLAERPVVLMAN